MGVPNQPEGRRERLAGGRDEGGRPLPQAGLPVREQFERLRRAFGAPPSGGPASRVRNRRRAAGLALDNSQARWACVVWGSG